MSEIPKKYRKKPVVIEAIKFTDESKSRAYLFVRCNCSADWENDVPILKIQTLEGVMTARFGDYIVKGVKGEFYPVRGDIFEATYEEAAHD